MFLLIQILASVLLTGGKSNEESHLYSRIPELMHQLCPGIDVCSSNGSLRRISDVTVIPGLSSCCTECSCSSQCSKTGNCCFPHASTDEFDEFQSGLSCLYPMFPQPETDHTFFEAYLMVSSIRKVDNKGSHNEQSGIRCGDVNIAPWGSLYPVFSAKSKQIYKNIECAKENGEYTDIIIWDVIIKCTNDVIGRGITLASAGLESRSIPEGCNIYFIFPGSADDLKQSKCYTNLTDTCPEYGEFKVPEGININRADIRTLCTKSGMVSPSRGNILYSNVFCFICNNDESTSSSLCRTPSISLENLVKSSNGGKFVALIDGNFATWGKHSRIQKKYVACFVKDKSRCRLVFCPTGQLRDRTGRCVYPSKIWYNQNFRLFINVTFQKTFNVSNFIYAIYSEPLLESMRMQNWFLEAIFYKAMDVPFMSDSVIFEMQRHLAGTYPNIFMKSIKQHFRSTWTVLFRDQINVTYSSSLSSSNSFQNYPLLTMNESFYNLTDEPLEIPQYERVYSSFKIRPKTHDISKLYFCEKVELNPSEFLLNEDESILYSFTLNRYLFDGQFEIVWNQVTGYYRARICIDEFGLYEKDGATRNVGTLLKILGMFLVYAEFSIFMSEG